MILNKNNINRISSLYLCSNCGTCINVCKQKAIEMKTTSMGRLYAQANENCNDCGLCQKVCPTISQCKLGELSFNTYIGNIQSIYVGQSSHKKVLLNAQSGGAVTEILSYLFEEKKIDAAYICRMQYGEIPSVHPYIATNKEDLYKCQKSCYTPVALLDSLYLLAPYTSVAIVGLPCHIEGIDNLINLQRNKYSNIKYKIGLICDRTLCGTIMDSFVAYAGLNKDVTIQWRNKCPQDGIIDYENAPVTIKTYDGKGIIIPKNTRLRLKNIFTPPRCRICHDKLNTKADIVLGDPWGIQDYDKKNGSSIIICRNERGNHIIKGMVNSGGFKISNEINLTTLINSQHIKERQKQVIAAATALSTLLRKTKPYLRGKKSGHTSTKDIILSIFLILRFICMETESKQHIIINTINKIKR